MVPNIFLLSVLPLLLAFGIPIYAVARRQMKRESKGKTKYSRARVIKITAFNLFLNTLIAAYSSLLLFTATNRLISFDPVGLILISLFLFSVSLTYYGNGIYATSVVSEAYTHPDLKKIPHFHTQFIATHLFHGPISHIMIYSGWLFAFLFLALFDMLCSTPLEGAPASSLVIVGGITGALYALSQMYNGTAPFQFISGLFSIAIFSFILLTGEISLFLFPIATYFFSFNAAFNIILFFYVFADKRDDGDINWDRSGY